MRGPSAGEGYWNQRAKRAAAPSPGEWTHTGDKYFVRASRTATTICRGRADDMFKVSGMWVSPFEVEAALASHEAVLEAAVIPKEDADGLIKPKAFIVLKNGFAEADERLLETLKGHVKEHAGPVNVRAGSRSPPICRAPRARQAPALQAARAGRLARLQAW